MGMDVAFKRTGTRRYAVVVRVGGQPPATMDPAPGYDDDIPHDLVHYVVEAELGLTNGVYGRAARGGGTFRTILEHATNPRERLRKQRKQQRRERGLQKQDATHDAEMSKSERLAGVCDLAWRRKHGQRPDPSRSPPEALREDAAEVTRIVQRLDALAPLWRGLGLEQELVFAWPHLTPRFGPP